MQKRIPLDHLSNSCKTLTMPKQHAFSSRATALPTNRGLRHRPGHFDQRLVAMDGNLDFTGGLDLGDGQCDRHQGRETRLLTLIADLGITSNLLRVVMVLDPAAQ